MTTRGDQQEGPGVSAPWGSIGLVIAGRYRLTAPLGRGQASTVYLADDLRITGRQVALKIARAARSTAQSRRARSHLLNEARALAAFDNPALPSLHDVLMHGDHYALVLDYLPGRTLKDVAGGWSVLENDVLDWGLRLCDVLVYLHTSQHRPLTHGAVRAEHCMLLPNGRLVLFDLGTAVPATEAGRRQDTLDLAVLLDQLLTGTANQAEAALPGGPPPVSVDKSAGTLSAMLQRVSAGSAPAIATLRSQLLDVTKILGQTWNICPACQARVRLDARHCGYCGATVRRDGGRTARTASVGTQVLRPPIPSAPPQGTPAASAPPAGSGRLRLPTATGAAGQTRRLTLPYADRLRAVGRYLDQHHLRRATIVESGAEIFLRGLTQAGGPQVDVPPETVATATLGPEDLIELEGQARQRRKGETGPASRPSRSFAGTTLFPLGYEDSLRALGAELDSLRGVAMVSLVEAVSSLYLDYDRSGSDLPTGFAHQHLVLSATDLETMRAAAMGRRHAAAGRGLSAMIQRARER